MSTKSLDAIHHDSSSSRTLSKAARFLGVSKGTFKRASQQDDDYDEDDSNNGAGPAFRRHSSAEIEGAEAQKIKEKLQTEAQNNKRRSVVTPSNKGQHQQQRKHYFSFSQGFSISNKDSSTHQSSSRRESAHSTTSGAANRFLAVLNTVRKRGSNNSTTRGSNNSTYANNRGSGNSNSGGSKGLSNSDKGRRRPRSNTADNLLPIRTSNSEDHLTAQEQQQKSDKKKSRGVSFSIDPKLHPPGPDGLLGDMSMNSAGNSTGTINYTSGSQRSSGGKILVERNMTRKTRRQTSMGGKGRLFAIDMAASYQDNPHKVNLKNGQVVDSNSLGYIHQLGTLNSMKEARERPMSIQIVEDTLSSVILKSLDNEDLCDVELVGRDGVPVGVSSFLLGAHSEVFQGMFYGSAKNNKGGQSPSSSFVKKGEPSAELKSSMISALTIGDTVTSIGGTHGHNHGLDCTGSHKRTVELSFAEWDALSAAMHFLASRTLPESLEDTENCGDARMLESNIRFLCQIHLFGRLFKIPSLTNHAYRTARRLMNKTPKLVCAAFDECTIARKRLDELGERLLCQKSSLGQYDELVEYALEYLRDSPVTTLLAGGTRFLSEGSIEAVICDQDMDVDEYTMFHILNTWVMQDKEENVKTGRALVSQINLSYIKTDFLKTVVKNCGFVDASDVEAALADIEEMQANQSPDEKEHVLVEGAGYDELNGIYVRMDEDIGLGGEEIMFVREALEDEYCPDYGLYLLRSTWAITSCVDYSNILYSYERSAESTEASLYRPPHDGWVAVGGTNPPPTCTWKPSKADRVNTGNKGYVAPSLSHAMGGSGRNLGDVADGDHDEGKNRRLTLRTMLNLPTDEGHEDDDYHNDMQDSETSKEQ